MCSLHLPLPVVLRCATVLIDLNSAFETICCSSTSRSYTLAISLATELGRSSRSRIRRPWEMEASIITSSSTHFPVHLSNLRTSRTRPHHRNTHDNATPIPRSGPQASSFPPNRRTATPSRGAAAAADSSGVDRRTSTATAAGASASRQSGAGTVWADGQYGSVSHAHLPLERTKRRIGWVAIVISQPSLRHLTSRNRHEQVH